MLGILHPIPDLAPNSPLPCQNSYDTPHDWKRDDQMRPLTDKGKKDYRKRKWLAEPPNGWIKNVLGFRQFSMRGLDKAKAEFKLVCLALNLRRMGAMHAT